MQIEELTLCPWIFLPGFLMVLKIWVVISYMIELLQVKQLSSMNRLCYSGLIKVAQHLCYVSITYMMHVSLASVVKFVGVVMVFPCLCDTPVTSCFWHAKSFLHQAIPFRQDLIQKTKE